MLLIIEALLLISAALQDHRTAAEFPLNMADDSVDDQFYLWYNWCAKKMEHRVQTEFLKKEMNNYEFATAWKYAERNHKTPGDNLSKNHSVAIYVYTNKDSYLYQTFNNAVRNGKKIYKDGKYSWYSLHFWLTEAIQILKKTQTKCLTTYRGTNVEFKKDVKGKEVRFGQFASSSIERRVAEGFARNKYGPESCFEIYTCSGADVSKYSAHPDEKEVLIPPYETFTVTDVKTDLWCKTVYILKSYSTRSDLSCAASSGNQVAFLNVLLILIVFCDVVSY